MNDYELPFHENQQAFVARLSHTDEPAFAKSLETNSVSSISSYGPNDVIIAYSNSVDILIDNSLGSFLELPEEVSEVRLATHEESVFITAKSSASAIQIDDFLLEHEGDNNIFVGGFNPEGECQWAYMPEALSGSGIKDPFISVDATENIFISAYADGMLRFEENYTDANTSFIAAFSPEGGFQWLTSEGLRSYFDEPVLDVSEDYIYVKSKSSHFAGNNIEGISKFSKDGIYMGFEGVGEDKLHTFLCNGGSKLITGIQTSEGLRFTYSDDFSFYWEAIAEGTFNNAQIYDMIDDNQNNLYSVGAVTGKINYFEHDGERIKYIAKHNANGDLIWKKQLPDAILLNNGPSYQRPMALSANQQYLYFVGGFNETVTIDGQTLTPQIGDQFGLQDNILIAKFNLNGNLLWMDKITLPHTTSPSVAANDNQVFISGVFSEPVTVNGNDLEWRGSSDAYVACFDTSGEFEWINTVGGEQTDYNALISCDEEYAYFTGEVTSYGEVHFFDSTFTAAEYEGHVYLAKIDSNGNTLWLERYGNDPDEGFYNSGCWPTDIFTVEGYTYVKGVYGDGVEFGDITLNNELPNAIGYGFFIGKFDEEGEPVWVSTISKNFFEFDYNNIDVDNSGNVYYGAQYRDSISINGTIYSPYEKDLFITRINNEGDFEWVKTIEGNNFNHINSICASDTSTFYVTGIFRENLFFDENEYVTLNYSGFLAKISDDATISIEENTANTQFCVYPNPTSSGKIYFKGKDKWKLHVTVKDLSGKMLIQKYITDNHIDISHLSKGVYIVTVKDGFRSYNVKVIHQ